jgi:hypothetical protein
MCFQLAGVVAVEVTGGPTIDFVPGRKVCYCGIFLEYSLLPYCSLSFTVCPFLRIQVFVLRKGDFQMLNEVVIYNFLINKAFI